MFLSKISNWGVNLGPFVSWVNEGCELFLVPSRSSSTPFYPSKRCELKSVPDFLLLRCFLFRTYIWVPQEVGSASLRNIKPKICYIPTNAKARIKEKVIVFGTKKVSFDNHMCHRHHTSGICMQTLTENNKLNLQQLGIHFDHYWVLGRL
jgi:hypothetical protein